MVTARDLKWKDKETTMVVVGPDTARVCRAAARRYDELSENAELVVTAGFSEKFKVTMGNGPMYRYLRRTCRIDMDRVYMRTAGDFNTNGEMKALASYLEDLQCESPDDTFEIHLAASWWHWLRAYATLTARLKDTDLKVTKIHAVLAPSWSPAMFLEPLAWAKNIRKGNIF
ncbi:MAG: hypothetical protein JWM39_801 [Parcubacteria group bacterium]|nr:hypothetical protein [Parcubacteria group bacterium]